MALVYQPQPLGSDRRIQAICTLLRNGSDGAFAIVHQDACATTRGAEQRTCVPSVWRYELGKT